MARSFKETDIKLRNELGVHYLEWAGRGRTLVFLHPSTGYARIWEWTAAALGEEFHIYAPDQRGHGRTDKADGDYSAQEYAEDLNLLFHELGLDRAVVVGHSLGGRVGQVFAAEYPDRVLGLGLVAGPHLSNLYGTREGARSVMQGAYDTCIQPTEFASREEAFSFLRARRPWLHDPDAALDHRLDHNYVELGDGRLAPRYDTVRVAQGLSHMSDNLRPYAARVQCPVFIFRASRGPLTPEKAQDVARFWPNAEVVDVEGHYALQMENPVGLANAISAAFLGGDK